MEHHAQDVLLLVSWIGSLVAGEGELVNKKLKQEEDSVEKPVAVSLVGVMRKVHQLNSTEAQIRTHKTLEEEEEEENLGVGKL